MSCICIITALAAESRVFIDTLKLRQVEARGLRLYGRDHYLLLQTGIGKLRASAGTAALLHSRSDISLLINAGVAGGSSDIGTVHLAHQVVDVSTGAHWYPHLPPIRHVRQLPSVAVHTVDQPDTRYQEGIVYDMEASGIFSSASTYLSTDAMQSIKVVSDNKQNSIDTVNAQRCSELMERVLPHFRLLDEWHLSRPPVPGLQTELDTLVTVITAQIHHTTNEQRQLHRQLQRLSSLNLALPTAGQLGEMQTARQIRQYLQNELQRSPLTYGASH